MYQNPTPGKLTPVQEEMWDLNGLPDRIRGEGSEDGNKGKGVGSQSNSSSSALVIEEGSEEEEEEEVEEEGERTGGRKRSCSAVIGSSDPPGRDDCPVTRQFFPVEVPEEVPTSGGSLNFPRAHWVGVKFCQSDHLAAATSASGAQPLRKSRRGPRSRSSQYRGVTFYRRTGRWESHIWFVPYISCNLYIYHYSRRIKNWTFHYSGIISKL